MQEVDPCEDLTDEDIRTAIQNATGPRSALFVPEVGLTSKLSFSIIPGFSMMQISMFHFQHALQVPFEVLIRRQIAHPLDPSVQCARFIYDELIKVC